MSDVYGSIRACMRARFFQSVVLIELSFFGHVNIQIRLMIFIIKTAVCIVVLYFVKFIFKGIFKCEFMLQ